MTKKLPNKKDEQIKMSATEQARELNYKIGRKISENSPTYKKLDTGIL